MIQCSKVGDTVNRKCPKCSAELILDNENNKLKCEYCRSVFDLNETKKEIYTCSCGAEIISSTELKKCIYCNSKDLTHKSFKSNYNIDYIIPFEKTKKDAMNAFKKLCKDKWFMPKSFNINKKAQEIKGIYIPVILCDYDTTGVLETECDDISTWKSKGYKYTKTDKYKAVRGGNVSFEKILVNASNNFQDEILEIIEPYNFKGLKTFDKDNYNNYLIEKNNKNKEDLIKEANEKTKNCFKKEMIKDIKGFNKIKEVDSSINLYNLNFSFVLLPIWFLNIKYKNKTYTFAMNGQTGKINDNTPIDKKRIIFLWISTFLIVFALLLLLNLFKVIL